MRIILGMAVAVALSSCINMSTLQTAEVLDKGEGRVIIGGGYYTSPSINAALEDAEDDAEETTGEEVEFDEIKVPYAEVGYRYGLTDDWEVGGKFTLIGTMAVDAKYQFLDAGDFAMATGLGLGYVSLESEAGDSKSESTIIDVVAPLYASYRMSSAFALYTSPKVVYRQISNTTTYTDETESDSAGSTLVGGTLGAMVGDDWGLALEGTYFKDTKSDFDMIQTAVAFFF